MIVSVLRKEARENLKGKWKKAILMMLIFFITTFLLEILRRWIAANTFYGFFSLIVSIAITISLNYGMLASMMQLKRNEKINVFHFIYYTFRDFDKHWKVIGRLLFYMLGHLLLLLFFIYLTIQELVSLYSGNGMRLSFFVEIIGTIVMCILFTMKVLYYSLNNYILFDNRGWKSKDIIKESERLMKNHRWDIMRLGLSFLGWFALGILFCAGILVGSYFIFDVLYYELFYISYIPLIFILPYTYVANICFYDNLLYNNPKPKEEINNKPKRKSKNINKKNKKNK